MPAVMDTPEIIEHEEHALYEEQLQVHATHPGLWHTLRQYVRRHRVHRLQSMSSFAYASRYPIETPADLLARQYPSLYIRAYAGV